MSDWRELFERAPGGAAGDTIAFRVARRRGHDLLVLPADHVTAAKAMTLYPAQKPLARLAKMLLRTALAAGIPVPLRQETIFLASHDALTGWLKEVAGTDARGSLAILAGNPLARGRRFVLLAFRDHEPAAVAKIGIESEARALIDRESAFLGRHASSQLHLPRLLGMRQTDRWHGLATGYVGGAAPAPESAGAIGEVLRAWIHQEGAAPLARLAPWRRLAEVRPAAAGLFESAVVAPVLFHGDFAPWNVRCDRAGGRWTVLDWERGEAEGVPGWDWFHWLISVSILVHRHETRESMQFLNAALRSEAFAAYARAARIAGLEQALLASYLLYMREFLPSPELDASVIRLCEATASWL